MEALREWAVALCGAAVLCAGAGIIAPDEKQNRRLRMILASVMLCAVVLPLARLTACDVRYDIADEPFRPDSRLCSAIEQQTASAVSGAVQELVSDCLEDLSVEAEDISVVMDISEDGCISIGQVAVRAAETGGRSASEIEDVLYSRLGLKAEVTTSEEEKWN